MSEAEYPQDCFWFNRWLLRFGGLWPNENWSKPLQFLYGMYSVGMYLFIVFFTLTEFATLFYASNDVYTTSINVNFYITQLMGCIKVSLWYFKKSTIIELMNKLEADDFRYEHCKEFQPSAIIRKHKLTGVKYSIFLYIMACMSSLSSYIPPMLREIFTPSNIPQNATTSVYDKLPYETWMPFDYSSTRPRYMTGLIYQLAASMNFCLNVVGVDMLFVNILNFITGHFILVQGAFVSMGNRVSDKLPEGYNHDHKRNILMNLEMKKCIRHLQMIIRIRDDLEEAFKFITLGQALLTPFIYCTSLYLLSTTPITDKVFFMQVCYLTAIGTEFFLYCKFGNEVTYQGQEVSTAIYACDWFTCDREFKQAMLLTLLRMNKPIHMTLGKFAPITLNTFVSIVKSSYSAFALLKSTESK